MIISFELEHTHTPTIHHFLSYILSWVIFHHVHGPQMRWTTHDLYNPCVCSVHRIILCFFASSSSPWLWFNITISLRSHNMQRMHSAHVKKINQQQQQQRKKKRNGFIHTYTHTHTPSYGKVRLWWCIALALPWARERIYPCTCTLHTHSLTHSSSPKHILSLFCWIIFFVVSWSFLHRSRMGWMDDKTSVCSRMKPVLLLSLSLSLLQFLSVSVFPSCALCSFLLQFFVILLFRECMLQRRAYARAHPRSSLGLACECVCLCVRFSSVYALARFA